MTRNWSNLDREQLSSLIIIDEAIHNIFQITSVDKVWNTLSTQFSKLINKLCSSKHYKSVEEDICSPHVKWDSGQLMNVTTLLLRL